MDLFWGAGKSTSLTASHPQPAQTSNTSSFLKPGKSLLLGRPGPASCSTGSSGIPQSAAWGFPMSGFVGVWRGLGLLSSWAAATASAVLKLLAVVPMVPGGWHNSQPSLWLVLAPGTVPSCAGQQQHLWGRRSAGGSGYLFPGVRSISHVSCITPQIHGLSQMPAVPLHRFLCWQIFASPLTSSPSQSWAAKLSFAFHAVRAQLHGAVVLTWPVARHSYPLPLAHWAPPAARHQEQQRWGWTWPVMLTDSLCPPARPRLWPLTVSFFTFHPGAAAGPYADGCRWAGISHCRVSCCSALLQTSSAGPATGTTHSGCVPSGRVSDCDHRELVYLRAATRWQRTAQHRSQAGAPEPRGAAGEQQHRPNVSPLELAAARCAHGCLSNTVQRAKTSLLPLIQGRGYDRSQQRRNARKRPCCWPRPPTVRAGKQKKRTRSFMAQSLAN